MAKPYQEGSGWSVRLRVKGQDIYLSGYSTEKAAIKAADARVEALASVGKPVGQGPWRTTIAHAMQKYSIERLGYLKGAKQVAHRFNRYLRSLGLDVIQVRRLATSATDNRARRVFFSVQLVDCPVEREMPNSLKIHRSKQNDSKAKTDAYRTRLAKMKMAEVTRHQLQSLIDAMVDDGYSAATVALERAELRKLFNYARTIWLWPEPQHNPASKLTMPKVDNARDRVLSNSEWRRLSAALAVYGNSFVLPALLLLLETTMRSSEVLLRARWKDVDVERCVLALQDAKAGRREVPLSPRAMAVLEALYHRRDPDSSDERILPLTYEALKKAWSFACEKAGVTDATLHDLRHTGTTRYALVYNGNMPLLKIITGHKTNSQIQRYINIKPDDVVRMMHGRSLDEDSAPAGMTASEVSAMVRTPQAPASSRQLASAARAGTVIRVDFGRRAA